MIPASEGRAMPGNNQATGLSQGSVQFGEAGTPTEPENGEMELRPRGHCTCPPFSLQGTKRGLGVEAALQERPGRHWVWQSSQPTMALVGRHGRVKGWGLRVSARVSLRPRSKEDTELSCTHVRAKLASATPHVPS